SARSAPCPRCGATQVEMNCRGGLAAAARIMAAARPRRNAPSAIGACCEMSGVGRPGAEAHPPRPGHAAGRGQWWLGDQSRDVVEVLRDLLLRELADHRLALVRCSDCLGAVRDDRRRDWQAKALA